MIILSHYTFRTQQKSVLWKYLWKRKEVSHVGYALVSWKKELPMHFHKPVDCKKIWPNQVRDHCFVD